MFCVKCGRELPDNARFCPGCGADQYEAWNDAGSAPAPAEAAPRTTPRPAPSKAPAKPAAKPKEKFYDKAWFWLLCMAALLIWGFFPSSSDEEKEEEEVPMAEAGITLPEKPLLEDILPEGTPILDGGGYLLDDTEAGDAAYDAQYKVFRAQLDAAIRAQEPQICLVHALPLAYDTLGEEQGYPYFWLKSMSYRNGFAIWNGESVNYWIYYFTYSETPDAIPAMQAQVDAARERYLSLIPADAEAWTASKIVHDELVRNITYDQSKSRTHCHDIYGALVEDSAVCQGYAYAFSYIMSEWDLRSGDRSPMLSDDVNFYEAIISDDHAWNDAFISDADDTMVDVTWDDPDLTDAHGEPYILYDYFGLTPDEIEAIDHHEIAGINRPPIPGLDPAKTGSYHMHEGYYLSAFDLDAIAAAFSRQYSAGSNVLTVRFENQADYERICTWLDNTQEINDVLSRIGYYGYCSMITNDDCRVFNVLLDYPT